MTVPTRNSPTASGQSTREQTSQQGSQQSEGLSIQTLVIAAVASATAALVTSRIWAGGTVISAAMTPVIVSLVRQGLQRPVQHLSNVRTGRLGETLNVGLVDQLRPGGLPNARKRAEKFPLLRQGPNKRAAQFPLLRKGMFDDAPYGRVYGRRKLRWKTALVTGGLAFMVAGLALTLPELMFGGSLAGSRSTTLFGSGSQAPAHHVAPRPQAPSGGGHTSPTPSQGSGESQQQNPGSSQGSSTGSGGNASPDSSGQGSSGSSTSTQQTQTQQTEPSSPAPGGQSTTLP